MTGAAETYVVDVDELYPYFIFERVTEERPVRPYEDVREIPAELVDAVLAARAAERAALDRIEEHLRASTQLPL